MNMKALYRFFIARAAYRARVSRAFA